MVPAEHHQLVPQWLRQRGAVNRSESSSSRAREPGHLTSTNLAKLWPRFLATRRRNGTGPSTNTDPGTLGKKTGPHDNSPESGCKRGGLCTARLQDNSFLEALSGARSSAEVHCTADRRYVILRHNDSLSALYHGHSNMKCISSSTAPMSQHTHIRSDRATRWLLHLPVSTASL